MSERHTWRALANAAARYDWIGPELVRLTGREIPAHPTEWLALAAEHGYQGGYDEDLIALHVIGKLRGEERARSTSSARSTKPEGTLDYHVTLDKMAALVNRSKRTLEKLQARESNPLPAPDVEGGGGRPHEWKWSNVRLWLAQEFGRVMPEQFPSDRFRDARADRS